MSGAKLDALEEIIDDVVMATGKELVIFARFIKEIEAIRQLLENKGIEYSWIAGEVKMEDRGQMVKQFQENDNVKVFVAQIQTAGLGITLTAADTSVFYSLDFNYANYSQALARLHRIGQKNKVNHIHLIAKDTIDEKIISALEQKEDIAKKVVDDWRKYFN